MPSRHTNNLTIAASERDMLSILRAFASNLVKSKVAPKYEGIPAGVSTVAAGFASVKRLLERGRQYAFPLPCDDGVRQHLPYSPGAVSDLAKAAVCTSGSTYVLFLAYGTIWRSNQDALDELLVSLPEGRYGVAFLDADEYDFYNTVSTQVCLAEGRSCMAKSSEYRAEALPVGSLYEKAKSASRRDARRCGDLSEVAEMFAICNWTEYGYLFNTCKKQDLTAIYDKVKAYSFANLPGRTDEGASSKDFDGKSGLSSQDNDEEAWRSRYASVASPARAPRSKSGSSIDWTNPAEDDLVRIDECVFRLLCRFPREVEPTGQRYEGRNANIEYLVPGAAVRLESDWGTPYFKDAGIRVYDADGRRLGNLGGCNDPSDDDRVAMACLLPHIKATATDVFPLGATTNKKRKVGKFMLHLELDVVDLQQVLGEVHELLAKPASDRLLESQM